jgi:hypothetical protein
MISEDLYGEDSYGEDFYGSWLSRVGEKVKKVASKIPEGYSISTPKGVLTTGKGTLSFTKESPLGPGGEIDKYVGLLKQYWYLPAGAIALLFLMRRR